MALMQKVNALYNLNIESGSVRILLYPGGATPAAGKTLTGGKSWAYGAWAELIAANGITTPFWHVGAQIYTIVVADQYIVDIGNVTTTIYQVGVSTDETTAAGERVTGTHYLPFPLRVAANTQVQGRVANAAGGAANTVVAKVAIATNVGS